MYGRLTRSYTTNRMKIYADYRGDILGSLTGNTLPSYVVHMVKDSSIT